MWVDEKCGDGQRISGWSDPSVIKSNNPSEACRKCQGVVYDLESHHAKAGIYHKVCFKCDSCQKNLDSWYLTSYKFGRSCCSSLKKISFTSGTFPVMRRRNYIIYREYMLTYVCCSNSVEGRMNEYRNNGLTVIRNVIRVLPKISQILGMA